MELMALAETLKLVFNIIHFHTDLSPHFTPSIPSVFKILVRRGVTEPPLTVPARELVNVLLHLDLDGTPLWFNGWLLESKYAERPRRRFAPMLSYMSEPRHKAVDDDFWKLTTDNICCLTADAGAKVDLDEAELGLLRMMRERALEVGVMD